MKLALIGPTYPFRGGIAHHTTLLCKALRQNHDVKFISFTRQYPEFLFPGRSDRDTSGEPVKIDGVDYIIDSLNPLTWLAATRELKRYQPDRLILPWWVGFWAPQYWTIITGLKYFSRCEVVIICHNVAGHEHGLIERFAARMILSKGDLLITQSPQETSRIESLLGKGANVLTAFHPTYADLSDKRYTREQAKELLALKGAVLLFFGFVRDYKGLSILLEALSIVLQKKQVTLLVAGEFWDSKEHYIEQISRHKLDSHVRMTDEYIPNEQIAVYFGAADLVVQPYKRASGSGVCQLAFGFDRPVIGTDVGNLSEVIQDKVNGRIVAPGNSQELATAILWSLEPENINKLSANATRTKERFSWEKLATLVAGESPPKKEAKGKRSKAKGRQRQKNREIASLRSQ